MIDTNQILDALLPDLHADSYANLTFWAKPQLVQYLDDAAKQLSRNSLLFVERSTIQSTVAATATYPLPLRHNATLHISFDTTPLRPATTIELEARNPAFQTTPGNPDHWYEDDLSITSVALAPVPTTAAPLPMICAMYPPDLDTGQVNTLLQAPAPAAIHLSYFVLAKAYGSESETEEPDLANHAGAMVAMLEQVFAHLWGEGV